VDARRERVAVDAKGEGAKKMKIKMMGPTFWRGSRGPPRIEVWRGNLEGYIEM
jgi:hypothetical protein